MIVECVPADRELMVKVAVRLLPLPLKLDCETVPSRVAPPWPPQFEFTPSHNCIVLPLLNVHPLPIGSHETVAVNVTFWPVVEGFGLDVSVVRVPAASVKVVVAA